MWRFGRRQATAQSASTLVEPAPAEEELLGLEDLRAQIRDLTSANRHRRDPALERRLLELRHQMGIHILDTAPGAPTFAEPEPDRLPAAGGLPEFTPGELTPGLLRAGILRDGCVLVRGLVTRGRAEAFAAAIDRAYAERDRHEAARPTSPGYYEEFQPQPRFGPVTGRPWIKQGGGLLAADSPTLSFQMMEMFQSADLSRLVSDYLGEPALISVHKSTLRRAEPSVTGAWHQDGYFMGDVRSLNLWMALSRCGDIAPGLDILPRRLDRYLATATEEAVLDYTISRRNVEQAAEGTPILRPVFEPGDALFFDELFLHQTGSDPQMPNPRFAIENWFFGGSRFPDEYAPVAVG
jgi:hypothetical protein